MEYFSLLISVGAFAVAAWGIVERRWAQYATIRVRITEIVSRIEELNVDEGRDRDAVEKDSEQQGPQYLASALAGQRAMLTYQAMDLLSQIRRTRLRPFGASYRLTPSEHASLALSLHFCNDVIGAEQQWKEALDAQSASPTVLAAISRGYASTLFALGKNDEARKRYREAIDMDAGSEEIDRWEDFRTCMDWLRWEFIVKDGRPADPVRIGKSIALAMGEKGMPLLWQLRSAATETVFEDGEYRAKVHGFEDEPAPLLAPCTPATTGRPPAPPSAEV